MRMFRDKQGAELSVNVVIIAILAILVLVIVAFILTGGASKFADTVRRIISPVPKASDLSFAISECKTLCSVGGTLQNPKESGYCKKRIDYRYTDDDQTEQEVKGASCSADDRLKSQAPCNIEC